MDGWVGGWLDGWVDGQMGGWGDGCMTRGEANRAKIPPNSAATRRTRAGAAGFSGEFVWYE